MDQKKEGVAIGYLRLPDVTNDADVHQKIALLEQHCKMNGMRLALVLSESIKGSDNFKGQGWRDIENTLAYAEGRIGSVIIPAREMLTKDVSLYLLKEKELRDSFGVKIEVAEGRGMKKEQSRDLSLN